MKEELGRLKDEAEKKIRQAGDERELDGVRVEFLGDYVFEVEQQSHWNAIDTPRFLQNVNQWQINFSTHNLIIYQHIETSGGNVFVLDEPFVIGLEVTIDIHRPMLGVTDDMGGDTYAYNSDTTFIVHLSYSGAYLSGTNINGS